MNIVKMQELRRKQDREMRESLDSDEQVSRMSRLAVLLKEMSEMEEDEQLAAFKGFPKEIRSLICELAGRKCAEILLDWSAMKQSEGN